MMKQQLFNQRYSVSTWKFLPDCPEQWVEAIAGYTEVFPDFIRKNFGWAYTDYPEENLYFGFPVSLTGEGDDFVVEWYDMFPKWSVILAQQQRSKDMADARSTSAAMHAVLPHE